MGENVDIFLGEGGEVNKGTPSCPCFSAWGNTGPLWLPMLSCGRGERFMAFLDDVYVSTLPDRTSDAHAALGEHLHTKACICLHHGKTKIWNAKGEKPDHIDVLEKEARPCATGSRGVAR